MKSGGGCSSPPGPRQDASAAPNRATLVSAAATLTTLASISSTDDAANGGDDGGAAVDRLGGSGPAQSGLRRARKAHAPAETEVGERAEMQRAAVKNSLGAAAMVCTA